MLNASINSANVARPICRWVRSCGAGASRGLFGGGRRNAILAWTGFLADDHGPASGPTPRVKHRLKSMAKSVAVKPAVAAGAAAKPDNGAALYELTPTQPQICRSSERYWMASPM